MNAKGHIGPRVTFCRMLQPSSATTAECIIAAFINGYGVSVCMRKRENERPRKRKSDRLKGHSEQKRGGGSLRSMCLFPGARTGQRLGTMHLSGLVNERLASVVTAMPGYWNKRLKMISGNTGPPGLPKIIRTSERKEEVERGRWKGRNGAREKDRER